MVGLEDMELPVLETERLILRKMTLNDLEDAFEYASDEKVARYTSWNVYKSIEDYRKRIENYYIKGYENNKCFEWGIEHKKERKLIGTGGFVYNDSINRLVEIGYISTRKYWNHGYATEALKEILLFTFKNTNIERIQGVCDWDNYGSAKIMEKSGMKYEGLLRNYVRKDNIQKDAKMYSIIRDDFNI